VANTRDVYLRRSTTLIASLRTPENRRRSSSELAEDPSS
jgi:hypothetical protein